ICFFLALFLFKTGGSLSLYVGGGRCPPATQLLKKLLCSTTIKQKTPIAMNLLLLNRQEFKPLVFHL
ncbi:MAG: hypothetical protein ACK5JB_02375, partial [Pseudanabaena sp.]